MKKADFNTMKFVPNQSWIMAVPILTYIKSAFLSQAVTLALSLTSSAKKFVPTSSQLWILFVLPLYIVVSLRHFFLLDTWYAFSEIKYYFGFIFFYPAVLWCSLSDRKNMYALSKGLLILLIFTVILEAGLINLFPELTMYLGNYPDFSLHQSHRTQYFGFYQRPYGLGGSYAETSSLISILMTNLLIQKKNFSVLLLAGAVSAVFLCMSGTGYAFLILFFVVAALRSKYRIIIWPLAFVSFVVPFAVTYFPGFSDSSPLWKISAPYIGYLVKLKIHHVFSPGSVSTDWSALFFGNYHINRNHPLTWSDFGLGTFVLTFGLFGVILMVFTTAIHLNRVNIIPLLLLLISMGHYSALFSQTGQLVFCIFLFTTSQSQASERSLAHKTIGKRVDFNA